MFPKKRCPHAWTLSQIASFPPIKTRLTIWSLSLVPRLEFPWRSGREALSGQLLCVVPVLVDLRQGSDETGPLVVAWNGDLLAGEEDKALIWVKILTHCWNWDTSRGHGITGNLLIVTRDLTCQWQRSGWGGGKSCSLYLQLNTQWHDWHTLRQTLWSSLHPDSWPPDKTMA